jgi:nucleoporin NUP82
MPRIKSYTPRWLLEPAVGSKLFAADERDPRASTISSYASKKSEPGPQRTIARRGTEVFVANGREIKWGDMVYLKDGWEAMQPRVKREDSNGSSTAPMANGNSKSASGYRTIKTPVADDVRQLIISPLADYMAVVTNFTVHIMIIPDSSHLTADDTAPMKPRYFTLGPTTHVTTKSPVASAIWHPLGANGSALVTVTKDAVVRVWEISPVDRWSFDAPSLAVDLKKLADGTFLDQDFGAPGTTTNKSFSPDSFDMQVASACFGGRSAGGWSSMTLWIAMRGGDVYALCPLLPQKWAPPPTLIPSLSVSIVAKVAVLEDDANSSPQSRLLAQQQLEWMSDLDKQEPKVVETSISEPITEIYARPSRPGSIPRLQGPFEFEEDLEDDDAYGSEICDIFVIGEKTDTSELMLGEDEEWAASILDDEGLSVSVVCLLSTNGTLRVCLDIDGTTAQWLPPRNKARSHQALITIPEVPSLLTFQVIDTMRQREQRRTAWPVFSADVTSRYSFYIAHPFGLTAVSLSPWVFRLEQELQSDSKERVDFRIDLLVKAPSTRERIYTHSNDSPLAACVAFRDPDLGYFLLSASQQGAIGVLFDTPEDDFEPRVSTPPTPKIKEEGTEPGLLDFDLSRPTFQIPEELNGRSELDHAKGMLFTSRHQFLKNQEVRLSPATLEIFTNVHRLVGSESTRLNNGAAQLFTKLDSLPGELHQQIERANMVKQRIEKISGQDVDENHPLSDQVRLGQRLEAVQARQAELARKMEALRKKVSRGTGRPLSEKEAAWAQEVRDAEASLAEASNAATSTQPPLWKRVEAMTALKRELARQAEGVTQRSGGDDAEGGEAMRSSTASLKIPSEVRKTRTAQVQQLLDRETALVSAVKGRLERLSLG